MRDHLEAALPGYAACFDKLWESPIPWHLLRHYPTAGRLHEAGVVSLCQSLRQAGIRFQQRTIQRRRPGYNNLNQMTDFARGVLSSSGGGVLDTVASPTRTQDWSLDPLGNWASLTTNGTAQSRRTNQDNQVTAVGGSSPAYDNDGACSGRP